MISKYFEKDQKGVALVVVLTTVMMLALLAAFAMSLSYNYAKTGYGEAQSTNRIKAYYRAQAGIVDAQWRIRTNASKEIGGDADGSTDTAGNNFANANWDPAPYWIDLDNNAVHASQQTADDVKVDIGTVATSGTYQGLRAIQATGLDK